MSALLFLVILLVLVVFHELGHFLVAKLFGVRVDEFGVGYPPRALSFGIWGGTEYTVNWLPFGGFVKIYGEDGEGASAAEKRVSLAFKPAYAQILILAAGVIANMLLAWLLFSYAAGHGAPIAVSEASDMRDRAHVVITGVIPGSPAELAGIQVSDRILALGTRQDTLTDITPSRITTYVQQHAGEVVTATLTRVRADGQVQTRTLDVTPVQGIGENTKPAIGIAMGFLLQDDATMSDALTLGAYETWRWLGDTAYGMWSLLFGAVTGTGSLKDISGPVGIAGQVGNWYDLGLAYLAYFTAIISVNLAIINLLPLPALDGGRIVFVALESILRRRLPARATSFVNTVGFMLLIVLMLVVTWNDVWKLVR